VPPYALNKAASAVAGGKELQLRRAKVVAGEKDRGWCRLDEERHSVKWDSETPSGHHAGHSFLNGGLGGKRKSIHLPGRAFGNRGWS
jgi:hypothetical protein